MTAKSPLLLLPYVPLQWFMHPSRGYEVSVDTNRGYRRKAHPNMVNNCDVYIAGRGKRTPAPIGKPQSRPGQTLVTSCRCHGHTRNHTQEAYLQPPKTHAASSSPKLFSHLSPSISSG